MGLVLEAVATEGIAQLSYLIGDDKQGVAAVIDPRPDVMCYLDIARQRRLSITHVFETHIHADFMSGARELAERTRTAVIHVSEEGGASYGFKHRGVHNGDTFTFGSTVLTVRHTPSHTPEHIAILAAETKHNDMPWGVFTGDSLFVNSAGRPDLLGAAKSEKLALDLYDTLRNFYLKLPDHVIVYPGHGKGSPCGADIGDRLTSTIGYERRFNPFLQIEDKDEFVKYTIESAPPEPAYYKRMKRLNADGPPILKNLPGIPALTPKFFLEALKQGEVILVDTRSMLSFGGGHIEGAINLGARAELSVWAGWILEAEKPILLVLEHDTSLPEVLSLFLRTGYMNFAGYLTGGIQAWANAGLPMERTLQLPVQELKQRNDSVQVLDVRSPSEWNKGHIPNAIHVFLPDLIDKIYGLEKDKPIATYCDSGYRASLASSLLKQKGFREVYNVPGSFQAWQNANYPIEDVREGQ